MLERLARSALHNAGLLHIVRSLHRSSLRILMFHSFLPERPGLRETLARRCEYLNRSYHPVSLTEAAHAWRTGARLPANAVAITVDDGYRDFYEIAYPIFAAHKIPATVYLVTDFMDGKLWLWTDQLRYANAEHLADQAKLLPDRQRRRLLETLEFPAAPPPEYAPLTWDSVREMAANGIEFGAHTRTHPILSRVEDEAALRDEIEGSKLRIQQETGRPVLHFCYPNGRPEDIGPRARACVRAAGYETAVVSEEGFNFPGADPFHLRRIPADPAYTDRFFAEYLAGVRVR